MATGKEDFYFGYLMMQHEIYAALKVSDPKFMLAGYGLRDWLPPSTESFGMLAAGPSTREVYGQIPMDHDCLNYVANLPLLVSME